MDLYVIYIRDQRSIIIGVWYRYRYKTIREDVIYSIEYIP